MRKVYFSWKPRHPVLAWCGLILGMGALGLLLSAVIPEGGFSWKLWGFETHSFTVGDEEVHMRLDTSGFGRYAVEFSEDTIFIIRDGGTILEGFFSTESYPDLERTVLADSNYQIIEHGEGDPPCLLCRHPEDGYIFLAQVDGSLSAVICSIPGDVTEQEALDRAHRLQFTRRSGEP